MTRGPRVARAARGPAAAGLAAGALALATPLLAGAARPGYAHCSQFISELGETGAPHGALVNLAGFLPTGLFTLAFAFSSARRLARTRRGRWGFLLFSSVGWAYVASAFFPCDPGCPPFGSTGQQIHNAFGAAEYLAGGAGLALLGSSGGAPVRAPGVARLARVGSGIVLVTFAGMLLPPLEPVRGLLQRAAELALFLWMVVFSLKVASIGRPSDVA